MAGPPSSAAEAQAFLDRHYQGRVGGVEELSGGAWSRAFGFQVEGQALVVRFGAWREDFERDRTAMAFASPELPVPRVLEIGVAGDGYFAISERRFGLFLEELDAPGWRRVLPAVLRALDALRRQPVDARLRPESWSAWLHEALVDRPGGRVSGWWETLAGQPDVADLFVRGRAGLDALIPACPDVHHVLHLDLINRNVLVSPDQQRLEAIFDWGCLAYGDFLYEVAWFTFWSPWHPSLAAVDFRSAAQGHYAAIGLDADHFDERLACYEIHIGLVHLAYLAFASGVGDELLRVASRLSGLL